MPDESVGRPRRSGTLGWWGLTVTLFLHLSTIALASPKKVPGPVTIANHPFSIGSVVDGHVVDRLAKLGRFAKWVLPREHIE